MKQKVIIAISELMDKNRKPNRNENSLVRMPAKTRQALRFKDKSLTVEKNDRQLNLTVFHAFSEDIKKIRQSKKYSEKDLERIVFVTSKTFNDLISEQRNVDSVWLSDDIESTVLGADPEFLLFDGTGEIVRANTTGILNYYGSMGYDGAMAEIRPKPSADPEVLVENMASIFKHYDSIFENYIPKCACYFKDNVRDYPVGGHIHIGNPRQMLNIKFADRVHLLKVLNKILDELLAIPSIKLDGKLGSARRTDCQMAMDNNGYGYFGEYRCDSGEGDNRRLENRTLSGMWLLHPSVAKAVIGCAKVIVDEVYQRVYSNDYDKEYFGYDIIRTAKNNVWKKSFDGWKDIALCRDMHCIKGSAEIVNALNASDPRIVSKSLMKRWKQAMKSFTGYKKYSKYVDAFYEIMLLSRAELKKWPKELKENWFGKEFIINI